MQLNESDIRAFFEQSLSKIQRPYNLEIPQDKNIIEALWKPRVEKSGKIKFVSCLGQSYTFAEIDQLSDYIAFFLTRKVNRNELSGNARVAIQMPNITQYVVAMLGALKAGMTVVNCNPLYTETEIAHQLKDSKAEVLFVLSNISLPVQKVLPSTRVRCVVKTELFDLHPFPKKNIMNFLVKNVKKMVPETPSNWMTFNEALIEGLRSEIAGNSVDSDFDSDHIAFLQYTGGTTGVAKGAVLSHRNIVSNSYQGFNIQSKYIQKSDERLAVDNSYGYIFMPLPLYHIYTLTALFAFGIKNGLTSVLVPNPRDQKMLFKDALAHQYTLFLGINTLFVAMMNNPLLSSLKMDPQGYFISGGMAMLPEIIERWRLKTGFGIVEGYGSTEMSPVALFNNPEDPNESITGYLVSETLAKVIDDQGNDLPLGDKNAVGELCFKGPQVMSGYYNRLEESEKVIKDGWFITGDIGYIDENGGIKIVDRKKDMIIVSGFNVYPTEIEEVMQTHPSVQECAVVGVMNKETGSEDVVAHVITKSEVSEEELIKHAKKSLTSYKVPKKVVFAKELPKNNVGKILRRLLR